GRPALVRLVGAAPRNIPGRGIVWAYSGPRQQEGGHPMKTTLLGGIALVGTALALPAQAELLTHKDLSADIAVTMATTAMATCKTNGYRVSATVVGRTGEVIAQIRGDGTGPHTMENSFRKAYTSRTFRIPSGEMVERLKQNPTLSLI